MFSNKRKLIGFIIGLIMFAVTVTSLTYAYYDWQSTNTNITFNVSDQYFSCETDIDSSISNLVPVTDYKNGVLHKFKVNNVANKNTTFSVTMNIESIDEVLKDPSFKYKLMVDKTNGSNNCQTGASGCEEVANGNFSNVHVGNNNLVPSIALPNNSRYEYYFFMYIDGNMSNPSGMQSASMVSTLGVCDIYVTFDTTEGDTAVTPLYKKVIEGETYGNLPTPVRNDAVVTYNYNNATGGNSVASDTVSFTFGGWYKEQALTNQVTASTMVTSSVNHTIYPKWTKSKTITLPTPTKTGNTFGGWYSDSTFVNKVGDGGSSYNPSVSTPLYAKWAPITYTITYKDCGDTTFSGTHGNNYPQNYTYGVGATLDSPTKANNIFAGYYSNSTCTGNDVTSIGTSETENKIFYAKWDPVYYLNTSTNTYYITLAEALSAVASNQTIKAIGNAVETSNAILSSSKTGVKLDLNGKTITMGSYYIDNKGTLDIYNSNSNAAILQGTYIDGVIKNTGTLTTNGTSTSNALTIQNTSAENESRVIYNDTTGVLTLNTNSTITYITPAALTSGIRLLVELHGTLIVNGANLTNTITGKTNVDWGIYLGNANARMEMISGNLTTYGRSISNEYGTGTTTPAVEISGGTVSSTKSSAIQNFTSGTIKISGGTITTGSTGITNASTGTIKLIGGSITASTHVVYNGSTGIVDMTGGTHTGLVGLSNNSTGTVKITGGSITASKSGIYNNSTGTVIIGEDDGTVSTSIPFIKSTNANGGSSAVQMNNSGGTLNFYDGKITSDNGAGYALNSIADSIVNTPTGYVVRKTVVDGVEIAYLEPERTITYKDCGNTTFSGTHVSGYPTTYVEGIGVTLDIPTKTGYTFGGYYSSSACSGTAVTSIGTTETGNKTFYAKWNLISYTVKHSANPSLCNLNIPDDTVTYNQEYNPYNSYNSVTGDALPAMVAGSTCTGYSLSGWTATGVNSATAQYYTLNNGWSSWNGSTLLAPSFGQGVISPSFKNLTTINNAEVTMVSNWNPVNYAITYNLNGGTCSKTPGNAEYDSNTGVNIGDCSKNFVVTLNLNGTGATQSSTTASKDQTFRGLSSSSSDGLSSGALTGTSSSNINTSWNGNNTTNAWFNNLRSLSSGNVKITVNWTAVNITLPTITKSGYTCGYADSNSATEIQYASGGTYTPSTTTNSKTLYAVCLSNVVKVYVNVDGFEDPDPVMNNYTDMQLRNGTTNTGLSYNYEFDSSVSAYYYQFNNVPTGTYNVYGSKDSNHVGTFSDSTVDAVVNSPTTTVYVNYYTLTMTGTNVNSLKLNSTAVTSGNSVVVLGGVAHSITGTVPSGYTFSTWSKTSGTASFAAATSVTTTVTVSAASTINAKANANMLTVTIKKNGANCTNCNGFKVSIRTSSTATSDSWSGTTTTSSTLAISGAMSTSNTYYIFVGKDSNHKTTMIYSGLSFTGAANATKTINFYTLNLYDAYDDEPTYYANTNISVNGSTITTTSNSRQVVLLGGTVKHSISATLSGTYNNTPIISWCEPGVGCEGTITFDDSMANSTQFKISGTTNVTTYSYMEAKGTMYGHGAILTNTASVIGKYSGLYNYTSKTHNTSTTTWYDLSNASGAYKNGTITNVSWGVNFLTFYNSSTPTMVDLGVMQYNSQSMVIRFKPNDVSGTYAQHIMGNYADSASGCAIVLQKNKTILGRCVINDDNSGTQTIKLYSDTLIDDANNTYSVALTYDYNSSGSKSTMKLYINGEVEDTDSTYHGPIKKDNTTHMYIGARTSSDTNSFRGRVHEATVVNGALSQSAIRGGQYYNTLMSGELFPSLPTAATSRHGSSSTWYKEASWTNRINTTDKVTLADLNANSYARMGMYVKYS